MTGDRISTRTVVELDLVDYTGIARELEKLVDATVVLRFNDRIQDYVDEGLRAVNQDRGQVVKGTAGDNAVLVFASAATAHHFAVAVHQASARRNADGDGKREEWWFRIGAATGEIAVDGEKIAGATIIDAARLEAAGERGYLLVDAATWNVLPPDLKEQYVGPETITVKHGEALVAYRLVVVGGAGSTRTSPKAVARTDEMPPKVSVAHLPMVGEHLLGREEELARLDAAWDDDRSHLISVVARGGEGKTALVRRWLSEMAADGCRGARRVFGWSFYSQGTSERAASADAFVDSALRFFGDPEPSIGSAFERGARLARLVARNRNLLILDGLEPFQFPPSGIVRTGAAREGHRRLYEYLKNSAPHAGACVGAGWSPQPWIRMTGGYGPAAVRRGWRRSSATPRLRSCLDACGVMPYGLALDSSPPMC